ncbi:hypothetical protein TeGR_g2602 [Tetraparma gracilis]|uniref:Acyl-CoA dehydrogenase family member 11 n=1 Tax=Tetraparma gracilis TaxID=2962635 RepID=A0ABQ6MKJ4_9STRA|nr:hypothetical protein TeGR_g2602 [Tetraparma gracilis]
MLASSLRSGMRRRLLSTLPNTSSVRSGHELDLSKISPLLQSLSIPSDVTVSQFKHGQSNPTYVLSSPSTCHVLRKKPSGKLLRGAHAVDREARIMKALKPTAVPVPNVVHYEPDAGLLGTEFYIYEYVEADFHKSCALPNVASAGLRSEIYDNVAAVAAELHNVDFEAAGLGDFGKPQGYLARQTKVWTAQYDAAKEAFKAAGADVENPGMDYLREWLPQALPDLECPEMTTIVHGDIRIDNMLFDENSSSVAAVVDWELSTLGHPGADLALLCSPYHTPSSMPILGGLKDLNVGELGIPDEHTFVGKYVDATGSTSLSHDLDFHLAFASFRMGSILAGVYARSIAGNASSADAQQAGKLSSFLSGMGVEHAKTYEKSPGRLNKLGGAGAALGGARAFSSSARASAPRDAAATRDQVEAFLNEHVLPVETAVLNQGYFGTKEEAWKESVLLDPLKEKAKELGLWNLFLPAVSGMSNVEYGKCAEVMGRSLIGSEVFNCQAPDTGNMEVLHMFGTPEQQAEYLTPLMNQEIRSAFAMTEPFVASSDATNMEATITVDGDELVLDGRKWWTSNGCHPDLKFFIFMGRDADCEDQPPHRRHSMVLVPRDAVGVDVMRPLTVFGYEDAPHGHAEINFDKVRVPASAVVGNIGDGFSIAQARLGPGRIHHCMRLIGMAERSLELAIKRGDEREAFGKKLSEFQSNTTFFAKSRIDIDSCRLMVLNAAQKIDEGGAKNARQEIAMIKVMVPAMAKRVVDGSMQIFGGAGLSQDTPLAHFYAWARVLELADGPSEVHLDGIAKQELRMQRKKRE